VSLNNTLPLSSPDPLRRSLLKEKVLKERGRLFFIFIYLKIKRLEKGEGREGLLPALALPLFI